MAGPYNCDICEANQASVILGMIETGEQQFLCPPCFGRLSLDFAKSLLTPEEIAEQLGPMFVNTEATAAPRPKSRRRESEPESPAESPKPQPETTPGVEEPPAAASDG